jgi:hypothetical protein
LQEIGPWPAGQDFGHESAQQRGVTPLPPAWLSLMGDEGGKLQRRTLTEGLRRKLFHSLLRRAPSK